MDPYVLSSIALGAFAGFLIGRLFSSAFWSGLFGLLFLAVVIFFLVHGYSNIAFDATANLGDYLMWDLPAFVSFIIFFIVGIRFRKKSA
jgi:hypothetical protein